MRLISRSSEMRPPLEMGSAIVRRFGLTCARHRSRGVGLLYLTLLDGRNHLPFYSPSTSRVGVLIPSLGLGRRSLR